MSHRAGREFFDKKNAWSRRKDEILKYYLTPYLAKVSSRHQVLLVDGFAGQGSFGDGTVGSPVIMCEAAAASRAAGRDVRVWCIEADGENHATLQRRLADYSFANCIHGEFGESAERIAEQAQSTAIFLYLDPFTPSGIRLDDLRRISAHIKKSASSVELLLNFNSPSFVRQALAILTPGAPQHHEPDDPEGDADGGRFENSNAESLSAIVGGDWWKNTRPGGSSYGAMLELAAVRMCDALRAHFRETGSLPIRGGPGQVLKYHLVFATRHPDGLDLMNEAMVKSRKASLFHLELFSQQLLEDHILTAASDWRPRGDVILDTIRAAFAMFSRAEIRGRVEKLLKHGRLESRDRRLKINDETLIRRSGEMLAF